jgi:hypothetical protein
MIGYKYTLEQDAIDAVALVNTHYEYPREDDPVTITWTQYFPNAEDENNIFYYIAYDESLEVVLGTPSEF